MVVSRRPDLASTREALLVELVAIHLQPFHLSPINQILDGFGGHFHVAAATKRLLGPFHAASIRIRIYGNRACFRPSPIGITVIDVLANGTRCPRCAKGISTDAKVCPHCQSIVVDTPGTGIANTISGYCSGAN
jgi:hypothetical protein